MKDVLGELEAIRARGHNANRVFDDWLDLMIAAFTKNDDEYVRIVERYKMYGGNGSGDIEHFARALGALMVEMDNTASDILGQVYMAWNINNRFAGQYFTPPHVAEMMAKMTASGPGRIGDPACGSGIMLISAAKQLTAEQVSESFFVGQDIDETCVKMCALNMMFFNMNGLAMCGDSLANEVRKAWETRRTAEGGIMRLIPEDELPVYAPIAEALHKQAAIESIGWEDAKQLTLAL